MPAAQQHGRHPEAGEQMPAHRTYPLVLKDPQDVQLDLRLISATHRDLPALVADGKFRDDLYYRLAVLPIRLPTLRERPDDILLLLATHFLARAAATVGKSLDGFDEEAVSWLLRHRWPGNVRELENVVERAVALARGPRITLADMHVEFAASAPGARPSGPRSTTTGLQPGSATVAASA
jgi:DNA-binding NtrC family response regulator